MKLVIGIGCRRNVPGSEIQAAVENVMHTNQLNWTDVSLIASVELKQDEVGLLEYAKSANVDIAFYPSEKLKQIEATGTSEFVESITGTASVCEAAAIYGSNMGNLIVEKTKFKRVTVAIAAINEG